MRNNKTKIQNYVEFIWIQSLRRLSNLESLIKYYVITVKQFSEGEKLTKNTTFTNQTYSQWLCKEKSSYVFLWITKIYFPYY